MAVDYGIMNAVTAALQGTSEARRNRRAETANLKQEFDLQKEKDFNNAKAIQAEHSNIEALRAEALKTVNNIPHMKDYFNEMYDDQRSELKAKISASGNDYSKAVINGSLMDFKDGMTKSFQNDEKYQQGVRSSVQMANYTAYLENKDTRPLVSGSDRQKYADYIAGNTSEFTMGSLRSEYTKIDPADTYTGAEIDFDKIFDKQYTEIWTNYVVETGDSEGTSLEDEAKSLYPGADISAAKQQVLKDWARKDMGFNEGAKGTKPLDNIELEAQFRTAFDMKSGNASKAAFNMSVMKNNNMLIATGIEDTPPEQKGDVQIEGFKIFKDMGKESLNRSLQVLQGNILKDGDAYTIKNVTGFYDSNGVQIKPSDGSDEHNNMSFRGMSLVSKAIIQTPTGPKGMLLGSSKDKDTAESLLKEYGDKVQFTQTMVAEYTNDDAWFSEKQVFQEMNPTGMGLEKMMKESGVESEYMKSQSSQRELNKVKVGAESTATKRANRYRDKQLAIGNSYYSKVSLEGQAPITMDTTNKNLNAHFKPMIGGGVPETTKPILFAIASASAKKRGGDFNKTSQGIMKLMRDLSTENTPHGKAFQKALKNEGEDRDQKIFDILSEKYGDELGDWEEIDNLADHWETYA
tara:strand:+ start:7803 stop:9701 length:1899 start_codon:yes stop_codon:yes gene_type:complete